MLQERKLTPRSIRTRAWLPDAEHDVHPFATWVTELAFDLWARCVYKRTIVARSEFRTPERALIAANHPREVDGPILGTVFVQRRHLHFESRLPFFATREDLFSRGTLARIGRYRSRVAAALLASIRLTWFFPLVRMEPVRRVREFTLNDALRALVDAGFGDTNCASLLNARGRRETGITSAAGSVRVALQHHNPPLEAWWGLRRLELSALKAIEPGFRATIRTQLSHFADRLEQGASIYFSPQGTISINGHFGRIRGGFYRLARMTHSPPWIQPVGLAYDMLAPGRTRVVVHIGECVRANTTLDRRGFDAALRRMILQLVPITPSHLLAHFLLHGPPTFTRQELAAWMTRSVASLRRAGTFVDPALELADMDRLVARRLRWLRHKRTMARHGGVFYVTVRRDAAPNWDSPANTVHWLDNNLVDVVPDIDRMLRC